MTRRLIVRVDSHGKRPQLSRSQAESERCTVTGGCRIPARAAMFKNTFQSGFLSILYSIG